VQLNGVTTGWILLSGTYIESGAIRSDNLDGTGMITGATNNVVVNSVTTGTYTLEYLHTDRAGNTGSAVRTIYVLDPAEDFDKDGYTTQEEINAGSNPIDASDTPNNDVPQVKLIGVNPDYILVGDTYNDLGAIWEDDYDGTGFVTGTGNLNTAATGTYILTYSYTDSAGNTGSTTRTVKVLDPTGDEDGDGYTNEEEINN
jgi:hypothetical protein